MMKKELFVEGISCNHCKMAIESAVTGLKGITRASVDVGKKSVSLEYDEANIALQDIIKAIEDIGYLVQG